MEGKLLARVGGAVVDRMPPRNESADRLVEIGPLPPRRRQTGKRIGIAAVEGKHAAPREFLPQPALVVVVWLKPARPTRCAGPAELCPRSGARFFFGALAGAVESPASTRRAATRDSGSPVMAACSRNSARAASGRLIWILLMSLTTLSSPMWPKNFRPEPKWVSGAAPHPVHLRMKTQERRRWFLSLVAGRGGRVVWPRGVHGGRLRDVEAGCEARDRTQRSHGARMAVHLVYTGGFGVQRGSRGSSLGSEEHAGLVRVERLRAVRAGVPGCAFGAGD